MKDWSQLKEGANAATLTFTATAAKQPALRVNVLFTATKPNLPGDFKGRWCPVVCLRCFRELNAYSMRRIRRGQWRDLDRGCACYPQHTSQWCSMGRDPRLRAHPIRSFNIPPPRQRRCRLFTRHWPLSVRIFFRLSSCCSSPSFSEYDFFSFNTISNSGNITVTTYVAPSWNAGEKSRPLAFAVQLDGGAPQTQQFFPQPAPGGLPPAWGGSDGFVANSIVNVLTRFTGVTPGKHTLKVRVLSMGLT